MSAIKKQTSLRWTHENELTDGGAILCTNWRSHFGPFSLQVTNYPGSRTLDWEITQPEVEGWWTGGTEDRYECTVTILKDRLARKAEALALAALQRK